MLGERGGLSESESMRLGVWREVVGRKGWHSSKEGGGEGRWRKMAGRRVVHPLPLATIDPRGWGSSVDH